MASTVLSRSRKCRAANSPRRSRVDGQADQQSDLLRLVQREQGAHGPVHRGRPLGLLGELFGSLERAWLHRRAARAFEVPGRGGPRILAPMGLCSMIDLQSTHPRADRSTRNRPDTTDTPCWPPSTWPSLRGRPQVAGTTLVVELIESADSALAFDLAELQVDGRHSWWEAIEVVEQIANREK